MRRFAGIEPGEDCVPDEMTILTFRHLLEGHGLTEAIFAEVNAHLADKGITLCSGRLGDVSRRTPLVRVSLRKVIDARGSTRNKEGERDPEVSSTKKGNDWFFGMKAHVGDDAQSAVVYSLETTTAKVHDSQVRDHLLHGDETSVRADKGYVNAAREAAFSGPGRLRGTMRKAPKGGALYPIDAEINRIIVMVRARVDHPFRVIKRQFG